jgi:transposase
MVIQQQARSLSVLVSFREEKKRIIEELLRQFVSQCSSVSV